MARHIPTHGLVLHGQTYSYSWISLAGQTYSGLVSHGQTYSYSWISLAWPDVFLLMISLAWSDVFLLMISLAWSDVFDYTSGRTRHLMDVIQYCTVVNSLA